MQETLLKYPETMLLLCNILAGLIEAQILFFLTLYSQITLRGNKDRMRIICQ